MKLIHRYLFCFSNEFTWRMENTAIDPFTVARILSTQSNTDFKRKKVYDATKSIHHLELVLN